MNRRDPIPAHNARRPRDFIDRSLVHELHTAPLAKSEDAPKPVQRGSDPEGPKRGTLFSRTIASWHHGAMVRFIRFNGFDDQDVAGFCLSRWGQHVGQNLTRGSMPHPKNPQRVIADALLKLSSDDFRNENPSLVWSLAMDIVEANVRAFDLEASHAGVREALSSLEVCSPSTVNCTQRRREAAPASSTLRQLSRPLCIFLDKAVVTSEYMSRSCKSKLPAPARKGRPQVNKATNVAFEALIAFEVVTGRRATVPTKDGKPYGAFLDFVALVFTELGIKASPYGRARAVTKRVQNAPVWDGVPSVPSCRREIVPTVGPGEGVEITADGVSTVPRRPAEGT